MDENQTRKLAITMPYPLNQQVGPITTVNGLILISSPNCISLHL